MTPEQKKQIDEMSQEEMARLWRHSPIGNPLFQEDTCSYFWKIFQEKGGFTPEISKRIGW